MLDSDAPIAVLDEVVIAGGLPKRHRGLPGAQCLSNGELLVTFRSGSDKLVTDDGRVVLVRSTDGGRTWSDPIPILAEPGWDCGGGGKFAQLDDGTLLMLASKGRWLREEAGSFDVFETRPTAQPSGTMPSTGSGGETRREFVSFAIHSKDGGRTWGESGPPIKLFHAWTEPTAHRVVEVGGGRLMAGFHGADRAGEPSWAGVAFSEDLGRTWADFIQIARLPGVFFHEEELLRLSSGAILAVMRTNEPAPYDSYRSVSYDDGSHWTLPQRTGFSGHCPFLFALNHEITLCLYRDLDPERPGVSVSASEDDGESWRWLGQLYQAPNLDCRYPALLRLPTGQLLCVFYTSFVNGNSEIHGLFLDDRTRSMEGPP